MSERTESIPARRGSAGTRPTWSWLPPAAVGLGLVAVWQALSMAGIFPPYALPTPVSVLRVFVEMPGVVASAVAISLGQLAVSYALAVVVGLPVGIGLGAWDGFRRAFLPTLRFLYPIPGIAWVPIAILWFGLGNNAIVFTVFIASVFPLVFNTLVGVQTIDRQYLRVMAMFRVRGWLAFRRVLIPAALPFVLTGLRLSYGVGWRVLIGAEIIGTGKGLGFFIDNARWQLRSDEVIAGMVAIGVFGVIIENLLFDLIERQTIKKWGIGSAHE